ncbi:MAG: hypothetical protein ISS69_02720 [Phycisphaerae bacterium]|nr:hypothetical protein [Planctomycetota bacterium]MBL7219002.1 hypothetical protein [Phycisphaerae bacterium]
MDETITLTLPRLFAGQILVLLHEVQITLSSRQSYTPGGHLTAAETFKLIKYYQEITDAVKRQYDGA